LIAYDVTRRLGKLGAVLCQHPRELAQLEAEEKETKQPRDEI
jgi:hypothetical protein